MPRRAKIVCTLGPATASYEQIRALVEAGMDVARLNFSHGDRMQHRETAMRVRRASDDVGRPVALLADLQGPKIRLGTFPEPVVLEAGQNFTITTDDVPGTRERSGTTFNGLPHDVHPGDRLLIDDGRVVVEATEVNPPDVRTRVVIGGRVSSNKGLNLPGVAVSVPALSDKDEEDLRFALSLPVDLVALSFVRTPEDAALPRQIMAECGCTVPLIAKIEKPQAVARLEAIVATFDGIMVARGDLGVECPLEDVPFVQKRAVTLARSQAKPVIVATQMLESMISEPRPTRAEASDVANAILDGADAVMLSAETSVGAYPFEAVRTMGRIIARAEEQGIGLIPPLSTPPRTIGGAIARAAVDVATTLDAKYMVAFTQSGDTARRLSRYRSRVPLLAFTPVPSVRAILAVQWGVETFLVPPVRHTDEMVDQVDNAMVSLGRCRPGDRVVIVAGSPPGTPGSTNALRVYHIGGS